MLTEALNEWHKCKDMGKAELALSKVIFTQNS